jgi:hypothetical protein
LPGAASFRRPRRWRNQLVEALLVNLVDDAQAVAYIALSVDARLLLADQVGGDACRRLAVKDDVGLAVAL